MQQGAPLQGLGGRPGLAAAGRELLELLTPAEMTAGKQGVSGVGLGNEGGGEGAPFLTGAPDWTAVAGADELIGSASLAALQHEHQKRSPGLDPTAALLCKGHTEHAHTWPLRAT
jgi:hypothetical protein